MASGILGSVSPLANTDTTVYTVPSGKLAVLTINACNTSAVAINLRVSLSSADTPVAGEYIEYNVTVHSGGVIERAGVVLNATKKVVVQATSVGLNINVWGVEE